MILAAVLLAQTLAAAPTPPAVVKAGHGTTRTLSDLARERRLSPRAAPGTFSVAGVEGGPGPIGVRGLGGFVETSDDALRSRYLDATAASSAASAERAAAENSVPSLVTYGRLTRGEAAAHAVAAIARDAALLPYRAKEAEAQRRVESIKEEASRAGVPGLAR